MQRLASQAFVPRVSPEPHVEKNFGSRFIILEIPGGLGPDDPEAIEISKGALGGDT